MNNTINSASKGINLPTIIQTGVTPLPFTCSVAKDSSNNSIVYVEFGQVNNITPTIGGIQLDNSPAPYLASVISGSIYLKVTIDNYYGNITSAEILNNAIVPTNTTTNGYLVLASVNVNGSSITIYQSISTLVFRYLDTISAW